MVRKVSGVVNFGVFVEMEPGISALLHKSEIDLIKSGTVKEHVSVGDLIEVEIKELSIEAKRMSLKYIKLFKNKL